MKKINVGINGFGRIGRSFLKLAFKNKNVKIVAVNDKADCTTLAHLLKYDSIHGVFNEDIKVEENCLILNGERIHFSRNLTPNEINWSNQNVDVVVESTGRFKKKQELQQHLKGSVKKIVLSSPPIDDIKMIVLGVNDHEIKNTSIISNASCTTNSAAPMIKVIDEFCGINKAYVTTIHSYTTDQTLHDTPHKDLRRGRAAAQSIVPTTTGAAKALTRVFPHLKNKLGGCGMRVPVPNGSLIDITFIVDREKKRQEINNQFRKMSTKNLKKIIYYCEDPIVSTDIIGSSYSCIFDSQLTSVIGNMVKVVGWYDNEIGYSNRLIELVEKVG